MTVYEILNRMVFNNDEEYIKVSTPYGGVFKIYTDEVDSSNLGIYSRDFLNAPISYMSIDNGHLFLKIEDFTNNEHWKLAEDINKLYRLHGFAKMIKEEDERAEQRKQNDMYEYDD